MHIFFIKKLIKALLLRQLVSGKQVHWREICQPSFIKHLLCARKCDKNFVCSILLILPSNSWLSVHCMSLSSHFGEVESEAQRGCVYLLSRVQLFVNCQAPLSMKFSRQEYWSGLSFPTPGDLPNPRDCTHVPYFYLHWQAGSLPLASPGKPYMVLGSMIYSTRTWEQQCYNICYAINLFKPQFSYL